MNDATKQNIILASAAVCAVALAGMFANQLVYKTPAAPIAVQQAQQPNVVVQPLVVLPSSESSGVEATLGGQIHNIQESFDAGIAVNGTPFVDSNRNSTSVNFYVSGASRGNVAGRITGSMSSSATSTACTFYNGTAATRSVTSGGVVDTGTAASVGDVRWHAGTSTGPYNINGVSMVTTTITRANAVEIITTTSTADATRFQWRPGEYINFISNTTTNAGTCSIDI